MHLQVLAALGRLRKAHQVQCLRYRAPDLKRIDVRWVTFDAGHEEIDVAVLRHLAPTTGAHDVNARVASKYPMEVLSHRSPDLIPQPFERLLRAG
jgi:hypothetical protein